MDELRLKEIFATLTTDQTPTEHIGLYNEILEGFATVNPAQPETPQPQATHPEYEELKGKYEALEKNYRDTFLGKLSTQPSAPENKPIDTFDLATQQQEPQNKTTMADIFIKKGDK